MTSCGYRQRQPRRSDLKVMRMGSVMDMATAIEQNVLRRCLSKVILMKDGKTSAKLVRGQAPRYIASELLSLQTRPLCLVQLFF